MKEDIFAVSGAIEKALATKAVGKKASVMSELHGGVLTVFSGKSNIFSDSRRKTYDGHGLFMFPETAGLSPEEKEEKEKEHQERRMEQMAMYQSYHDLIRDEAYAPRGSKMTCSYGTKIALLDTMEDHGVYKGPLPVMTCKDCRKWNLHDFGSCMCPESMYRERIDMTVPMRNGYTAQKAPWNQYPHICVPLINEEEGWRQTIDRVWIVNEDGEKEPLLICNSSLVCRYGGIITVDEPAIIKGDEINRNPQYLKYRFKYDWTKEGLASTPYVTEEFLEKVITISGDLGIDPDDLMAVMAFESWITPDAQNKDGAYGLIQFTNISLERINKDNGTNYTKDDVKAMDIMQQLDLAYLHFKPKAGKMKDIGDVYLAVFAPAYVDGTEKDDDTVLYSLGKTPKFYKNNDGLDINKDTNITKKEAYWAVIERREGYYRFDE